MAPTAPRAADNQGRLPPAGFSAERLGNGWHRLNHCPIGDAVFDLVVIQPGVGVILLELEPNWTPEAVELFRRHLDAAGFSAAYPGHLPAIHRRLRPQDEAHLDFLLLDAFAWQDPISIADAGWDEALLRVLTPSAPAALPAVEAASDGMAEAAPPPEPLPAPLAEPLAEPPPGPPPEPPPEPWAERLPEATTEHVTTPPPPQAEPAPQAEPGAAAFPPPRTETVPVAPP
nr:hypothetical protein [Rubritepida sp.]